MLSIPVKEAICNYFKRTH